MVTETKELVCAAAQGDRSAMAGLYSLHIGWLTAVCSRYIPSQQDRNDVLQSSFIKIFTSLEGFEYRGAGSLRAWMTRIVVNEALKFLRATAQLECMREEKMPDVPEEEEPEVEEVPPAVLQRMIQELPGGYRTVFNLYVFEQKSHREIAQMLGIKESTSASQFHRARAILAKRIKDYLAGNMQPGIG